VLKPSTTLLRRPWIAAVAVQWMLGSSTAFAYCRTTTCGSSLAADCRIEVRKCPENGAELYWPDREVTVVVENGSGLRGISTDTARAVLTSSMTAWTTADCGGKPPSIGIAPIEILANAGAITLDATADSVNALRFFDDAWPYEPNAVALTTVQYGLQSGKIFAADIETNSSGFALTVVDVGRDFDLQSVLTHESGHFFGLSHVLDPAATMYATYTGGGNVDRRSLEDNDRQGICAVYPPGRFGEPSGCGCEIGKTARGSSAVLAVSVIVLAVWRRRRSRALAAPKN